MRLIAPSNQITEPVSESPNPDPGAQPGRPVKKALKNWLPKFLVREIQSFRKFKKTERPIYLKLKMLDSIGMGKGKTKSPATARAFVFVCFGNIMRSPMCEALMKRECVDHPGQIKVASAGLHASPGNAAHPWALAAAREFGVSLEGHRAKLLTADMVNQADAIFAMDYQNQVELLARYPEAKEKIFMLGAHAGDSYRQVEIADPYYGDPGQTRVCYQVLEKCVQDVASGVLRSLRSDGKIS